MSEKPSREAQERLAQVLMGINWNAEADKMLTVNSFKMLYFPTRCNIRAYDELYEEAKLYFALEEFERLSDESLRWFDKPCELKGSYRRRFLLEDCHYYKEGMDLSAARILRKELIEYSKQNPDEFTKALKAEREEYLNEKI